MTALEAATGLQRLMFGYRMLRAADAAAQRPS
jgi:hypothetical protein